MGRAKTRSIHPAVFLGGALALSGAWLWLRPALDGAEQSALVSAARSQGASGRPQASVSVDAETLQRYAGKYEVDGIVLEIGLANGRLFVDAGQLGRFDLAAVSARTFSFEAFAGHITFDADGDRPAQRFTADLQNGRLIAKRVRD